MVDRGRARGRARTWPEGRARPWHGTPWSANLWDALRDIAIYCKEAAAVDFGPGRLTPWMPVAFGLGVAIYFTAEHEPYWPAAILAACAGGVVTYLARRRPVGFPIALLLTATAAGFAGATLRTAAIAHPVLDRPAFGVSLTGFVEVREERERSDRIVIRVHQMEGPRLGATPERVRLSVRRGMAPPVGAFVSLKARLTPPQAPLRPGGYDFARDLYFQRIGAVGFVTGAITVAPAVTAPGFWLRYASAIDGIRSGIDARIRAALPGDAGAIASALITGKRDAISAPVNDAMYVSSLAHVLSISGYHMAVVAGVVFFSFRAALALVPGLAKRRPIKKWSAMAAFVAAAGYLALSGAEIATQRAFIMTAIVLLGVMLDRAALTLRTLAVAAMAVLLLAPEAVAHPSFQMSFAATLALVAAYERGLPWTMAGTNSSLGARVALWGVREIAALVFASLVAGLATTPYAAFHFHRAAPYGVLANLLAMPIVSVWVMPAGLLALLAMPFGFDAVLWRLMGAGVDWMTAVATWVTGLPGAVGRIPAFGIGALMIGTAGLVLMCLFKTRLRWAGAVLLAIACGLAATHPLPDILVSAGGESVAVRINGRLSAIRAGGDPFVLRDWLAADADARKLDDGSLKDGISCDPKGCIAKREDGAMVAIARTAEALAEDCGRAAVVVTTRAVSAPCDAVMIDRAGLRDSGAVALRRDGRDWRIEPAQPRGTDRPWARARGEPVGTTAAPARPAQRDATPKAEDLEPGD